VRAVDVLRDDVAGAVVGAADVEDRDDVRVIEVGDGAGFGQVGVGGFGTIHQLAVRNLDGAGPLQLPVVGEVDDAGPAPAEHLLDAVATDVRRQGGIRVNGGGGVCVSRLVRTGFVGLVHE